MTDKDLAKRIDVIPETMSNWKKERAELYRLLKLGEKVEANIDLNREYLSSQKELYKLSEIPLEIKETKIKKSELARRLDVDPKTIFNWEKTKPELLKLVYLALAMERHLKESEVFLKKTEELLNI